MEVTGKKYCVNCPDIIFSFDFSPISSHIYIGYVTGGIQQYSYSMNSSKLLNTISPISTNNKDHFSCRALSCNIDGLSILTGYENGELKLYNTELSVEQWKPSSPLPNGVSVIQCLDTNLFISGDDTGEIRVWDIRQNSSIDTNKSCEEVITNIIYDSDTHKIVFSSDDGSITRYNFKRRRVEDHVNPFDEEILSVAYAKNKKNIVFGTAEGSLGILHSTNWDDLCGKFKGHPDSIESIISVDKDSIITASGDGYIRLVNIIPNKFVGVIGNHKNQNIDNIKWSKDKGIFGCSYSTKHFALWDVSFLFEDRDSDSTDDDIETVQTDDNNRNKQTSKGNNFNETSNKKLKTKKVVNSGVSTISVEDQQDQTNNDDDGSDSDGDMSGSDDDDSDDNDDNDDSNDSNDSNSSDCQDDDNDESLNHLEPTTTNANRSNKQCKKNGNNSIQLKQTKSSNNTSHKNGKLSDSDNDSDDQNTSDESGTDSDGSNSSGNNDNKSNKRKAVKHSNPRDVQNKSNKRQKRSGRNFYADM